MKRFISLILLTSFTFLVLIMPTDAAVYKEGSSGETVKTIQTKLKNWGYYDGNIDGIYGTQTKNAVIYFQKTNNLTADGIAGEATLNAMGIFSDSYTNSSQYNSDTVYLLSRIISAEARGEPYEGQVAVGAVVLNRVEHPSFPNTVAGVIYQSGAFTALVDGQFNEPISESAKRAAIDALNGVDPSGGAIYYYNPSKSTSSWIFTREVINVIGSHYFAI